MGAQIMYTFEIVVRVMGRSAAKKVAIMLSGDAENVLNMVQGVLSLGATMQ